MIKEHSRQYPTAPADDVEVHDAILALALHHFTEDRAQAGERLRLHTVVHIAALASLLRGLRPASDVLLLGFELDGTVIQPLTPDVLTVYEERVRDAGAGDDLEWMCGFLVGQSLAEVDDMALHACAASGVGS